MSIRLVVFVAVVEKLEILFSARNEVVVGAVVVEKTIVIGALPIFRALELNLAKLFLFSVVDFFARIGNVAGVNVVQDVAQTTSAVYSMLPDSLRLSKETDCV